MARRDPPVRPHAGRAPRPAALRALGRFWLALIVGAAAGGAALHLAGPPAAPVLQAAAPSPAAPAPAPAPPAPTPRAPAPQTPAPQAAPVPPPAASPPAAAPRPIPAAAARPPGGPIPPPDPALLEPAPAGLGGELPRIGADGRQPMRAYAAGAAAADARPRIAVLVADFAMRESDSEEAVRRLPAAISFAVSPYAARPAPLLALARATGHELLAALPMEPHNYPLNDPGPRALLTGAPQAENDRALAWALSRFAGYAGATGALGALRGERFAASEQMAPVLAELGRRGLFYIDPRPGGRVAAPAAGGAPHRAADLAIDQPAAVRTEIDARLGRLEQLARDRGSALGLAAAPSPVVVERLAAWTALLAARGLHLVPASALILQPTP